jgi:hypothetical protein
MGTWYDYAIIGDEVLVWWRDGSGRVVRRHLPVEHAQSFVAMLEGHDVAVQAALRDGAAA